jgi:hypothetical protein
MRICTLRHRFGTSQAALDWHGSTPQWKPRKGLGLWTKLKPCKISGFHGGDYEEWRLLRWYALVALVRTDVSEELIASFIRVTRIGELGTTLALTSNRRTLQRNTKSTLYG